MTLHELIRSLSLIEAKFGGGTSVMIAMPNGGEWDISRAEKTTDSDGDEVVAIYPDCGTIRVEDFEITEED